MTATPPTVQVRSLLSRLRAQDSGRPRVTWYGAGGERVELSARVLENWVAKTAHLLVEELDVEVGNGVCLALPAHWRSVVWRLAVAAVGAELVDAAAGARVVVVSDGETLPPGCEGADLVVQALPALAFRAQGVPPGALDAAAQVAGFGDDVPVVPGAPGLLLDAAAAGPPRRVLLDAADDHPGRAREVLDAVAAALAGGGSAVLLGPGAPDAARVAAQEGAQPR